MASVSFRGVGKVYPDGQRAVDDLNLEIADGEFTVLVGPSGCGKTTSLRMAAGLEAISEGEILMDGRRINEIVPQKRDIAMVFQNYALYPHMTVFENIAFPLRSRGMHRTEVRERVERTARMLGVNDLLKRKPKTLSGGQRQRIAMGRAIVRQPQAFMMDEPLSNLDAKLRGQMRAEISALQRQLGTTTIYVTHNQTEAMTMGSRIAVLRSGVLQQDGSPQEVYRRPANLFVASFIGSPAMNLFTARLDVVDGRLACLIGDSGKLFQIPDEVGVQHPQIIGYKGRNVVVGIRPDYLDWAGSANGSQSVIEGRVIVAEMLGATQLVHLEINAQPVLTEDMLEIASDIDAGVFDALQRERDAKEAHVTIIARVTADVSFESGQCARLAIQPDRLHFFDPSTGIAI